MAKEKIIGNCFLVLFVSIFFIHLLYTRTGTGYQTLKVSYVIPSSSKDQETKDYLEERGQKCDFKNISAENAKSAEQNLSLLNTLSDLPWTNILRNESKCFGEIQMEVEKVIHDLVPFLLMEPTSKINSSCIPPPIQNVSCPSESKARKVGESLPKIAVIVQLGFDVDTLEIHLNELYDVVDKFFILESTKSHFGAVRKPLIWERVKDQSRFYKFSEKVVHFLIDDAESAEIAQNIAVSPKPSNKKKTIWYNWEMESLQERMMWEKFLLWNNSTKFFGDEDFIGFGDMDEIAARSSILKLKYCQFSENVIDIGIVFPLGRINQAFRTDFPVSLDRKHKLKYSLGDPTYWKLSEAKALYKSSSRKKYPTRQRGKSPQFILGGMHMSYYCYLPYQIVRQLTRTETSSEAIIDVFKTIKEMGVDSKNISKLEEKFAAIPLSVLPRIKSIDKLRERKEERIDEISILPWFYDCNRERYPIWEGKHDPRIDLYVNNINII